MALLNCINKLQVTVNYALKIQYSNVVGGMLGTIKKKKGKLGPMMEKKVLPVETDPEKLLSYCCGSNIYKTGEDVKLKPDSEYPDWLWSIRTGPPPPLEELDRNSIEYWRRVRKMGMRRNNQLQKLKRT
ncbi:39S ribosomal protein L54, mitochondrial [Agrilus planipennis]|uniref:Large ribosomal subunit protein mL54 n=1 Tax=Agrilus planipennis TaxID=224129 RepID=A0A1W4WGA9_AGRPL|nr:39S ribosomal protein L54, mitochondrial [Agrilus planipennis]